MTRNAHGTAAGEAGRIRNFSCKITVQKGEYRAKRAAALATALSNNNAARSADCARRIEEAGDTTAPIGRKELRLAHVSG